jgi:DNA-binding NtrC family response regulator
MRTLFPYTTLFRSILTRSPLMLGLFKTIERIAQSPLAVLVAG